MVDINANSRGVSWRISSSSDSSMVDINDGCHVAKAHARERSDSSMVDINFITLGEDPEELTSSDSSMVDINKTAAAWKQYADLVQIPLWSILTREIIKTGDLELCSDSSMVDINFIQRN